MADNITYTSGSAAGPPANTVIKTDQKGGTAHFQEVSVGLGPRGTDSGQLEGNTELAALIATAAYTTAQTSPTQTNKSHKGVMLFLDVTGNAGATKTLSVKIQAKDPTSTNWVTIYDFGVVVTNATGTFVCLLYPGITTGDISSGNVAKSGNLPRTWRAVVTPSDATAWTYSLGASGLIF